jgi:hypothetical protein
VAGRREKEGWCSKGKGKGAEVRGAAAWRVVLGLRFFFFFFYVSLVGEVWHRYKHISILTFLLFHKILIFLLLYFLKNKQY